MWKCLYATQRELDDISKVMKAAATSPKILIRTEMMKNGKRKNIGGFGLKK